MSLDEKIKAGGLLWADDVKQFIKELKESRFLELKSWQKDKIDQLAGKGLI